MQLYFRKKDIFCSIINSRIIYVITAYMVFFFYGTVAYANDTKTLSVASKFLVKDKTIRIAVLMQDSEVFISYADDDIFQCFFTGIDALIIQKVKSSLSDKIVCNINRKVSNSQELFALLENGQVDIVMYTKVQGESISYRVLSSIPYIMMKTFAFIRYREGSVFSNIVRNENVAVHPVSIYEKLFNSNFDKTLIPIYTTADVLDQLQSRYIYIAFLNEFDAYKIMKENPQILVYYKPILFKEDYVLSRNMYVNNSDLLVIINSAIQSAGAVEKNIWKSSYDEK